jgi:membrane-associated protein
MIPGISIESLIVGGGIIAIAAIIFAESGLLIGFFLPGDSLIFTAGFLISQGVVDFNIWILCAILFVCAAAGDSVGYEFGHKVGRRLFKKKESKVFKPEHLATAEKFYEKHGGKAIILARFVPIIRTFAPIVAGIGKMTYRHFLAFNLIGGFIWTFGVTLLGYFLGNWFTSMGLGVDQVLLPAIVLILLISVAPMIIHILKDKKSRDAVFGQVKIVFDRIFKKKK